MNTSKMQSAILKLIRFLDWLEKSCVSIPKCGIFLLTFMAVLLLVSSRTKGEDKMIPGYAGKMLLANLSERKLQDIEVSEELAQNFFGGYGFGAKVLYDLVKPNIDPLGPENVIGFTTGTLVATGAPCAVRTTVVGKSPLTHSWGDASCGGNFAHELKRAGYDAVFVTGCSEEPVYLWVNDGEAEIREAGDLWGKDTVETEDTLRENLGDARIEICSIGPGGEKLSLIACPIVDKGNAPGRSGLGAIMGAQKLKAVVARGTLNIPVADAAKLRGLSREAMKAIGDGGGLKQYGTCGGTYNCVSTGDCPTKNWAGGGLEDFPNAKAISDENVIKYEVRKLTCRPCPIACNGIVEVESGPYAIKDAQKPEYETLGAFGAMCLNDNIESIIMCNDICNRYGLDTISVGCTIAFAMECYENGLISKSDTDGIDLTWGNHEAVVDLTWKMAKREGFGDLLADGVKVAAEKIGQGSEAYAMHVHGQELPMHDPKMGQPKSWTRILAITYQADATPGRHTPTLENRDRALRAVGLCTFGGGGFAGERLSQLLAAAMGPECTQDYLEEVGERIACMRQAFNLREGITPKDFKLPDRILGKPPLKKGPLKGITIDADADTREYFETIGWDTETGKPNRERLEELGGFDKVIADLYS